MKELFFLYLLFCSLKNIAQKDHLTYHQFINRAENHLVNEGFFTAQKLYDSTFQQFDYVFAKDYVIATQVAWQNRDTTQTTAWMEEAIKAGYPCSCFSNIPVMETFLETILWQRIQGRSDSLRRQYLASIDLSLLVEWSRRYREEQDAKGTSLYTTVVQSNYDRIKILADSLGFPSERFIGLDNPRIAPNRTNNLSGLNNCDAANSKVIATLLHYDNPITDLGFERCVEAIKEGLLHPRQFASIFTFEHYEVSRINDKINKPDLPN
ncbi:MAG: hypothetical protein AAGG68_29785 [Bacteroidota bacterium]